MILQENAVETSVDAKYYSVASTAIQHVLMEPLHLLLSMPAAC